MPDHKALCGARPVRRAQHHGNTRLPLRNNDQVVVARSSTAVCAQFDIAIRISRRKSDLRAAGSGRRADRTIQMNDVFIDEREVVYCVDRHIGGLYCWRWISSSRLDLS